MLYYDVVSSIPFYESLSKKRRKIPADDRVEFHAGQEKKIRKEKKRRINGR